MRYIVYFIFFLSGNFKICYASEYINNNGFENYLSLPYTNSQLNNHATNWTSSSCTYDPNDPTRAVPHSPDYFYNLPNTFKFFKNSGPNGFLVAHTGNALVGLGDYESIRQEIQTPLTPNNQYIFSMYVYSGDVGQHDFDYDNTMSNMVIYLSHDEPTYDDEPDCNDPGIPCNQNYRSISGSHLKEIYNISLTDPKLAGYDNGWVLVNFVFTCPDERNILGQPINFNWISIDLTLNNYTSSTGTWDDCYKSYILVDDISLREPLKTSCKNS